MNIMPTITDSRGRESHTLFFVTIGYFILVVKFALAGLTVAGLEFPPMTAAEFGTAAGFLLGIWLGREWKQKTLDTP